MPQKKRASRAQSATEQEKVEIERQRILNRYWELANLDPEITKGNITGQLKALDSLCEELGLRTPAEESNQPKPAQEIYRAAWMIHDASMTNP